MDTEQLFQKCNEILRIAKPHIVNVEYRLGKDMPKSEFAKYAPDGEYVLFTCENGYTYGVDITDNSLNATAEAIFHAMVDK